MEEAGRLWGSKSRGYGGCAWSSILKQTDTGAPLQLKTLLLCTELSAAAAVLRPKAKLCLTRLAKKPPLTNWSCLHYSQMDAVFQAKSQHFKITV